MQAKKYKLREDDTIVRDGRTLYRIEALREVCFDVHTGEKGGYVESEANLSQEGKSWLYDDACAYEEARVEGDAHLKHDATIRGKAKLFEHAILFNTVIVQGEAIVGGWSQLFHQVVIGGKAILKGNIFLYEKVHIGGNAYLEGTNPRELILQGTTMIHGDTIMKGYGSFSEEDAIIEEGIFRLEGED